MTEIVKLFDALDDIPARNVLGLGAPDVHRGGDVIYGGPGDDIIDAGWGNDLLFFNYGWRQEP